MAGIDFDKLKNIVDDKFETVRVLDNDPFFPWHFNRVFVLVMPFVITEIHRMPQIFRFG